MKHTEEEKIVNEEKTDEKTEEKPKKVLQEKPNEKPTQEEKSVGILQDNTNSEVTDYGVISNLNAILKVENLHIEEERKIMRTLHHKEIYLKKSVKLKKGNI